MKRAGRWRDSPGCIRICVLFAFDSWAGLFAMNVCVSCLCWSLSKLSLSLSFCRSSSSSIGRARPATEGTLARVGPEGSSATRPCRPSPAQQRPTLPPSPPLSFPPNQRPVFHPFPSVDAQSSLHRPQTLDPPHLLHSTLGLPLPQSHVLLSLRHHPSRGQDRPGHRRSVVVFRLFPCTLEYTLSRRIPPSLASGGIGAATAILFAKVRKRERERESEGER